MSDFSDEPLPLYERAPALRQSVPRIALGRFPTPVEQHRVEHDGDAVTLLVKRDDLCSDGYAGNKVRKLEFLLADARARGATRLVTAGAAGSHHAFATAYHGIRQGFDVSLVLFPQPVTDHVREILQLDAQVGAELCWASRMETVPYGLWRARFAHRDERVCMIPPGGSNDIGTFGYINAGLELAAQVESGAVVRPSGIYAAAGTLGTVVGIAIGLAWAGSDMHVQAIRITTRLLTNERMLAQLARTTLNRLRTAGAEDVPGLAAVLDRVTLRHEFIGAGYGRSTPGGQAATTAFEQAGLTLDSTYTAKAAAALLADAPHETGVPLFWHTLSAVHPESRAVPQLPLQFARYLAG